MSLVWRRSNKRSYKTMSSSSSSSDSESQPEPEVPQAVHGVPVIVISDSSSSSQGDLQSDVPQPEPRQDQPEADDYDSDASTDLFLATHCPKKPIPETEPEENQPLTKDSLYYQHVESYDCGLRERQLVREHGQILPVLQWEIMSNYYVRWLLWFEAHGRNRTAAVNPPITEPSADVTLLLLRFQKEWLSWGLEQEASEVRGGILADEMGMGKTIQAISLVLMSREMREGSGVGSSSSADNNGCTLVICPLVALIQWEGEIERHTREGSVKVLAFHGAKRNKGDVDFGRYDFVLTTYGTVETEYRKHVMPPKETCENCGRTFADAKKLAAHQR